MDTTKNVSAISKATQDYFTNDKYNYGTEIKPQKQCCIVFSACKITFDNHYLHW